MENFHWNLVKNQILYEGLVKQIFWSKIQIMKKFLSQIRHIIQKSKPNL